MRQALPRLLALALLVVVAAPIATHAQDTPVGAGTKMKNDFKSEIDPMRARQIQREREAKKKAQEAAAKNAEKAKAADPAKAKADAMALANTLVASSGAPCTVTDAVSLGEAQTDVDGKKVTLRGVEAACQQGLGYILSQAGDQKAEAVDCIIAAGSSDTSLPCRIPANANPFKALEPYLVKAKTPCDVTAARMFGDTETVSLYEVKCSDSTGQVLQIAKPFTAESRALTGTCLVMASSGDGKTWPCKLTTEQENLAVVKGLAAKSTPPCTPTNQRLAAAAGDGSNYFEFACEGGAGVVVQASSKNEFIRSIDCAKAAGINGGCKLTDASAGVAALQSSLAGKIAAAGFKCDVAKIATLSVKPDGTEGTEFSCKGGPGGVIVTKADKTGIFNCGRSQAEGYACGMTTKDQAYTDLTNQLKANGKTTCIVNGLSPRASATTAWLEVSCADGNPGWMMKYARDSNTPNEIITCKQFKERGAGDCALPTNKKDAA